jgi:hypothetical protein
METSQLCVHNITNPVAVVKSHPSSHQWEAATGVWCSIALSVTSIMQMIWVPSLVNPAAALQSKH